MVLAAQNKKEDLFKFYWITLGYLWNDGHIEFLLKSFSQNLSLDYMKIVLYTRTCISTFESLPFRYRFKFIQSILGVHEGVRDEKIEDARQKWIEAGNDASSISED